MPDFDSGKADEVGASYPTPDGNTCPEPIRARQSRGDRTRLPRNTRLVFVFVSIVLISAAYLRGNHLIGVAWGITATLIVLAMLWLFIRAYTRTGRIARIQAIAIAILSLPIGWAMAYPAAFNPDVGYFIREQATARAMRAELTQVFGSDASFAKLSISMVHRKVVWVTVHGSLPSRNDLDRLRLRIASECPTVYLELLRWDIEFQDSRERIDGRDSSLFPPVDGTG